MGLRGEAASEVAVWACGAAAAGGGGGGECGGVGLFSSPLCVLSLASFFAEEGEPSLGPLGPAGGGCTFLLPRELTRSPCAFLCMGSHCCCRAGRCITSRAVKPTQGPYTRPERRSRRTGQEVRATT